MIILSTVDSFAAAEAGRHVLLVAYYFPPLGGIGSVRMGSFARFLPEYGWRVTILAATNPAQPLDPDLRFPPEKVIRTGSLEISRVGKQVLRTGGTDSLPARLTGARRGIQAAARRYVYFPDAQIGWYLPALRVGRAAVKRESFDAVFSSAFPVTAHLIARRLARQARIPWVAEYRDPFSDLVESGTLNRQRARRLERSIAKEAAGIVMSSPSWARAHAQRWDRPVSVITNGYDETIRAYPPGDEFVLAHLGSLYPQWQDLTGLCRALCNLIDRGRAPDRLCFIGEPQLEVRKELTAFGLGPRVEVTGIRPLSEALERLRYATALLLVGPKDGREELRGWSSGKMYEYLASDLPVIYVGDTATDAAHLLAGYEGCYVVGPRDVEGLVAALLDCRDKRFVRDVRHFSRRALTEKLATLLDEACGFTSAG